MPLSQPEHRLSLRPSGCPPAPPPGRSSYGGEGPDLRSGLRDCLGCARWRDGHGKIPPAPLPRPWSWPALASRRDFGERGRSVACGFVHGLSFHPLLSGAPASLGSMTCLLGRLLLSLGTVGMCRPEPRDMTTGCDCSDRPVRVPQTHCPLRLPGCCVRTPFHSDGKGPPLLTDLTGSSASSSQSGG